MEKKDCKVGMVVYNRHFDVRGVVQKCNPKRAKIRIIDEIKNSRRSRGVTVDSLWNMPYANLEIFVGENLEKELVLKSFGQKITGLQPYFKNKKSVEIEYPPGHPEWDIMQAICKIWKDLSLSHSGRRPEFSISDERTLGKLFLILGRHVSKEEAESWYEKNNFETVSSSIEDGDM